MAALLIRKGKEHLRENLESTFEVFKNSGEMSIKVCLGVTVILTFIGQKWAERIYTPIIEDRVDFLQRDIEGANEFTYQAKLIFWAHWFFVLKDCKGFDEYVGYFTSASIESGNFELRVATSFLERGFEVEFVRRTGVKGADFDFRVVKNGIEFQVEVKNCSNPENDEITLTNVLSHARRQLPKNGNGIIYVSIPDYITKKSNANNTIEEILSNHFRNTTRVKAIVLEWDEWFDTEPAGKACANMFRVNQNPRNFGQLKEVADTLDQLIDFKLFEPAYLNGFVEKKLIQKKSFFGRIWRKLV
jgi:hypothetical protein